MNERMVDIVGEIDVMGTPVAANVAKFLMEQKNIVKNLLETNDEFKDFLRELLTKEGTFDLYFDEKGHAMILETRLNEHGFDALNKLSIITLELLSPWSIEFERKVSDRMFYIDLGPKHSHILSGRLKTSIGSTQAVFVIEGFLKKRNGSRLELLSLESFIKAGRDLKSTEIKNNEKMIFARLGNENNPNMGVIGDISHSGVKLYLPKYKHDKSLDKFTNGLDGGHSQTMYFKLGGKTLKVEVEKVHKTFSAFIDNYEEYLVVGCKFKGLSDENTTFIKDFIRKTGDKLLHIGFKGIVCSLNTCEGTVCKLCPSNKRTEDRLVYIDDKFIKEYGISYDILKASMNSKIVKSELIISGGKKNCYGLIKDISVEGFAMILTEKEIDTGFESDYYDIIGELTSMKGKTFTFKIAISEFNDSYIYAQIIRFNQIIGPGGQKSFIIGCKFTGDNQKKISMTIKGLLAKSSV